MYILFDTVQKLPKEIIHCGKPGFYHKVFQLQCFILKSYSLVKEDIFVVVLCALYNLIYLNTMCDFSNIDISMTL